MSTVNFYDLTFIDDSFGSCISFFLSIINLFIMVLSEGFLLFYHSFLGIFFYYFIFVPFGPFALLTFSKI